MRRLTYILTLILLVSSNLIEGKDSLALNNLSHHLSAEIRPTYNLPTHGYYRGYNEADKPIRLAGAAHIKYGFSLDPQSQLGQLYPTAYQGIGVGIQSFFHHELTGTPLLMYIFQGGQIADIGNRCSIGYEWNLGASYGWKSNNVVSSPWNIYINIAIPFTFHLSQLWDLSFGPEYTHYSNGDTTFPNGGANTVGCRIGLTAKINEDQAKAPGKRLISREVSYSRNNLHNRLHYDLILFGAWRADRMIDKSGLRIINKAFPTAGISFNPLYRLNRYFCAGAALDLLFDRSADISYTEQIDYPSIDRQFSYGISARGELTMPFFSINIGAGYSLSSGKDLKGFYTTYTLKTFLTENVFLNIGYKLSSVLYSHNLMLGLGVRL